MVKKWSLDEYTDAEKLENGNNMYGGKRHDEICDYLQSSYGFNETQINDISMGIWLAIEAERAVGEGKIKELESYKKDWQEIAGKANLKHLVAENDKLEKWVKHHQECVELGRNRESALEKKIAEYKEHDANLRLLNKNLAQSLVDYENKIKGLI